MPAPETPSDEARSVDNAQKTPKNNDPGYKDLAAIGIGCLIFVIFFAAIVIAGVTRE